MVCMKASAAFNLFSVSEVPSLNGWFCRNMSIMRLFICSFLLLMAASAHGAAPDAATNAPAAYPTEYWTSDKGGWSVKTASCGDALCAYLVDFRLKPTDPPGYQPVDEHNPDHARRQ